MHILLAAMILVIAYFKVDIKDIRKYGLTLYYIITCNLLYNILCHDHLLWKYKPDLLPETHLLIDLIYTFIILPTVALLYLSHFPFNKGKQKGFIYISKWVAVSLILEFVYLKMGRIELQNGYEYWMEFLFYPTMYGMLRLHPSRPLLTYILSFIIILFFILVFDVPIK